MYMVPTGTNGHKGTLAVPTGIVGGQWWSTVIEQSKCMVPTGTNGHKEYRPVSLSVDSEPLKHMVSTRYNGHKRPLAVPTCFVGGQWWSTVTEPLKYMAPAYGIDVKSSNSTSKDAFLNECLWREESQGSSLSCAAGNYSVKPPQPGRWQSNSSYIPQGFILIFRHHSIIFASMPASATNPCGSDIVASRQANRFTDWAIRGYPQIPMITKGH